MFQFFSFELVHFFRNLDIYKTLNYIFISILLVSKNCLVVAEVSQQKIYGGLYELGGKREDLLSILGDVEFNYTVYLSIHAADYDRVNLTAEMIAENVNYARKVHVALPYLGKKLNDDLWREWVLPHRVLEEDVSFWRKDLHVQLQPVVEGKKTVREVVEAIHVWLVVGNEGKPAKIKFGNSENRCKTPGQMLRMGSGACGEMNMMFVACLRAVGIPARHCRMNWRYGGEGLHYYTEYWDAQAKEWAPIDASDEKPLPPHISAEERSRTQGLGTLAFYAHPGFPEVRDIYHTACLEKSLPVTGNMFATYDVKFHAPAGFTGDATAYVWNTDAWRATASGSVAAGAERPMQFANGQGAAKRPVLFTVIVDGRLFWALQPPTPEAGPVELKAAVPGECLSGSDYAKP